MFCCDLVCSIILGNFGLFIRVWVILLILWFGVLLPFISSVDDLGVFIVFWVF